MSTKDDVDEERDRNQSLSTNDIDVRLTKSMSQRERVYDPKSKKKRFPFRFSDHHFQVEKNQSALSTKKPHIHKHKCHQRVWNGPEDYHSAMMYTGLDLGVEFVVFACTIVILTVMFPELSSWRILSGLIRTNFSVMILLMVACWLQIMYFQCFYFGWDPTFRFEWVKCTNDANATWNGGFDWDC